MTWTPSEGMQIVLVKGNVSSLIGMSLWRAVWKRFWIPKWSQNRSQIGLKSLPIVPISSQVGSKSLSKDLETTFGLKLDAGSATKAAINSKTPAILEPKSVQTQPGTSPKSVLKRVEKRLRNELATETDFWQIFSRFWSLQKQIFDWNLKPLRLKLAWPWT